MVKSKTCVYALWYRQTNYDIIPVYAVVLCLAIFKVILNFVDTFKKKSAIKRLLNISSIPRRLIISHLMQFLADCTGKIEPKICQNMAIRKR